MAMLLSTLLKCVLKSEVFIPALSGETPLHTAAIRGSPRLVRQLLVMGADPNAQDHAEWSPLHEVNRATLF